MGSLYLVLALSLLVPVPVAKEPCSPVPAADQALYNAWGGKQSPALRLDRCADMCVSGLRLCLFIEIKDADQGHLALCNGRHKHKDPCRLVP